MMKEMEKKYRIHDQCEGKNASVQAAIVTPQFLFECMEGISVFYAIWY